MYIDCVKEYLKMTSEEVLEFLKEENPDAMLFENPSFEKAIIGYTENNFGNYVAVYNYNEMIDSLAEHINPGVSLLELDSLAEEYSNESEDPVADAIEWIEYNSMRSLPYMGENAPTIIYT